MTMIGFFQTAAMTVGYDRFYAGAWALMGRFGLTSLGHDSFALRAASAGAFLVRVRFTRYWTVTGGNGCVGRTPGGWTSVRASVCAA